MARVQRAGILLFLINILGCVSTHIPSAGASTSTTALPAPPAVLEQAFYTFTTSTTSLSKTGVAIVPLPHDLNGLPIRVWAYRNRGELAKLRVVGHASEKTCREASAELLALSAQPSVGGFISFGVGELAPRNPDGLHATEEAVAHLSELAGASPGELAVVEVEEETEDHWWVQQGQALVPNIEEGSVSFGGQQLAGPLFAPFGVWTSSGVVPIKFQVSRQDLGLSAADFRRLSGTIDLAPYIEAIDLIHERLEPIRALLDVASTSGAFEDHVWSFSSAHVAPLDDAEARRNNAQIEHLITKYQALKAIIGLTKVAPELFPMSEADLQEAINWKPLDELEAGLAQNRSCLGHICASMFAVRLLPPSESEATNVLEELLSLVGHPLVIKAVQDQRASLLRELKLAKDSLRQAQRLGTQQRSAQRERLVDALLRGWPVPTTDQSLAARLDRILATDYPRLWQSILKRLEVEMGVRLDQEAAIGGLLLMNTTFFRVTETSSDMYSVQPYTVVFGNYLENWDAGRHLFSVSTPDDGAFFNNIKDEIESEQ